MEIAAELYRWLWPRQKKVRWPRLERPGYADICRGKVPRALVLGSGPSLRTHRETIRRCIRGVDVIVLAANRAYLGWEGYVDFIGFTNRRRLCQYGKEAVATGATILIGSYIPDWVIREVDIPDRQWERLPYVNDNDAPFGIRDGVIQSGCGGSGPLLIATAAVMGASEIWVAGMDGYPTGVSAHAYDEPDANQVGVMKHQEETRKALAGMAAYFKDHGIGGPWIMTPTVFREHYREWRE